MLRLTSQLQPLISGTLSVQWDAFEACRIRGSSDAVMDDVTRIADVEDAAFAQGAHANCSLRLPH